MWQHPWTAFLAVGGVVLTVTGAEALYADMGHFGRRPIELAWFAVAFPALVLAYLGQTAAVVRTPDALGNPFFAALPSWATLPMVGLATVATVIASQAVITGAFSAVQQAGRLNLLPRLRVIHTSSAVRGQIYLPAVNLLLAIVTIGLVLVFQSSTELAAAYGIAVTLTFAMTTTILLILLKVRGRLSSVDGFVGSVMLLVIALILSANISKVDHGGWLPLGVGICIVATMWIWRRGFGRIDQARHENGRSLASLRSLIADSDRTPGFAVFVTGARNQAPGALLASLKNYGVLPETVLVVSHHTGESPRDGTVEVHKLDSGLIHATVRFGYLDPPHVVKALEASVDLIRLGIGAEQLGSATYLVSSNTVVFNGASPLPAWQQRYFLWLDRMTAHSVHELALPTAQTVVVGRELPL